jgi:hypothetical protein
MKSCSGCHTDQPFTGKLLCNCKDQYGIYHPASVDMSKFKLAWQEAPMRFPTVQ